MNKLDKEYQMLLEYILGNGVEKKDRTGTGTISVFGTQIRHNMKDGFPLLTTKRMAVKTMLVELKWFLKGDTNIKYLVDNKCNVWNGDAYKKYKDNTSEEYGNDPDTLEEFIDRIKTDEHFAAVWGELGPIYGSQWRSWRVGKGIETTLKTEDGQTLYESGSMYIDQIADLIKELKTNPDSRRLMVSAWNVGELTEMTLPPCHYGFQMYTRELNLDERIDLYNQSTLPGNQSSDYFHEHMDQYGIPRRAISLMWNQRSVDTFLGLPFNISSYGALLCLIAEEVNMVPDELIGNLGDTHLYSNHIEQANEQVSRVAYPLPTVKFSNIDLLAGKFDYEVLDYKYHPSIKAPLSN